MPSVGLETCRMQCPKNRFPPRTNFPIKDKGRKPFQKEWMDNDTRQDLRRKKLCFTCQEPWVPGHRCSGKGKAYYIEAYFDSGEDEDYQDQEQGETPETIDEGKPSGGTIVTMTRVPRFHTLRIRGTIQGHGV